MYSNSCVLTFVRNIIAMDNYQATRTSVTGFAVHMGWDYMI